jgi:hypothetical protein
VRRPLQLPSSDPFLELSYCMLSGLPEVVHRGTNQLLPIPRVDCPHRHPDVESERMDPIKLYNVCIILCGLPGHFLIVCRAYVILLSNKS